MKKNYHIIADDAIRPELKMVQELIKVRIAGIFRTNSLKFAKNRELR
jgi:hypothetical protein